MELTVEKKKLSKQLSYPLSTSDFQGIFESLNFDGGIHLVYDEQQVLCAYYWLPNQHIVQERFYITLGACAREEKSVIDEKLRNETLPELETWMKTVIQLPANSPQKEGQIFERYFDKI